MRKMDWGVGKLLFLVCMGAVLPRHTYMHRENLSGKRYLSQVTIPYGYVPLLSSPDKIKKGGVGYETLVLH